MPSACTRRRDPVQRHGAGPVRAGRSRLRPEHPESAIRKPANSARFCPRMATCSRGRLSICRALPLKEGLTLVGASAAVCMAAVSPAAQAAPSRQARFLHAVPMAAPAVLIVHGHPPRLPSSYGKPSPYHACHPGPAKVELKVEGQAKPAATAELEIGRGPLHGHSRARRARAWVSASTRTEMRCRARPACGPSMPPPSSTMPRCAWTGSRSRRSRRTRPPATRRCRPAGTTCRSPGRAGPGGALASASDVPLVAGSASTAIVVGSGGEPTQVLMVSDQTAGPSVAPATGFIGDRGEGGSWLLVLSRRSRPAGSGHRLSADRSPPRGHAGARCGDCRRRCRFPA